MKKSNKTANCTQDMFSDKEMLLEEYKIVFEYIMNRDALRWTILGASIGIYGVIISEIARNFVWNYLNVALALIGAAVLTVATIQNSRLYEYCKVARRRASELESKLGMKLFNQYKELKLLGMNSFEISRFSSWTVALIPIAITLICLAVLYFMLGVPNP